jgi:hypothetical protein
MMKANITLNSVGKLRRESPDPLFVMQRFESEGLACETMAILNYITFSLTQNVACAVSNKASPRPEHSPQWDKGTKIAESTSLRPHPLPDGPARYMK